MSSSIPRFSMAGFVAEAGDGGKERYGNQPAAGRCAARCDGDPQFRGQNFWLAIRPGEFAAERVPVNERPVRR